MNIPLIRPLIVPPLVKYDHGRSVMYVLIANYYTLITNDFTFFTPAIFAHVSGL